MRSSPHLLGPRDFISIVITSFFRPFYLKRCLESIKQFADMPYEIIVHDDGSSPALRDEIYKLCSENASTLILNLGTNMGLNVSANRAVSIAQSDFVLFLNEDCFFTKPGLKQIASSLAKPYIGFLSPTNLPIHGRDVGDNTVISNGHLGGGHAIAFRKEVWQEVSGWNENNTTGQSDNVFLLKIIRAGYFKGFMTNGPFLDVTHPNATGYIDSFSFAKGNDCSYPKLFNFPQDKLLALNHKRREFCQYWVDGERTIANRETFDNRPNPVAGLNDFGYWDAYLQRLVNIDGSINWNMAEWGQDKWKDLLEPRNV